MNLTNTWQETGDLEALSSRIKTTLDSKGKENAVEELRNILVDKCTFFGATTIKEGKEYQKAQAQKAAAIFKGLAQIGELDNDFLLTAMNKYGNDKLPETQRGPALLAPDIAS